MSVVKKFYEHQFLSKSIVTDICLKPRCFVINSFGVLSKIVSCCTNFGTKEFLKFITTSCGSPCIQKLPEAHPLGPRTLSWLVQIVHFCPWMPGLQTHRPVICSQSSRTEPKDEQPQAKHRNGVNCLKMWFSVLTNAAMVSGRDFGETPISGLAAVALLATNPRPTSALLSFGIASVRIGA